MNYKDIETYNYDLDESLIAQTPIKERDHSKLLVVNKNNGNYHKYCINCKKNICINCEKNHLKHQNPF